MFYGISTFVGYLTPIPFQRTQFIMSTQFNYQKTFLFQAYQFIQSVLILLIQFSVSTDFVYTQLNVKEFLYKAIQFSVNRVSMSKTVPFQTIQVSISIQFKCKYRVYVSKTFLFQAIQFCQTV